MNKSKNNGSPFIIGKNSDTGRRRQHNEDSYKVFEATIVPNNSSVQIPALVAVVADGVGGAVGGQEASRIAVETIEQRIRARFLTPPISRSLEDAMQQANQAIHQHISQHPELKDMSSTVVVALMTHNRLYVSHAGDSRAYLIRRDQIRQLTVDHTWVQEAIEAGRLTPEQAKQHPNRNVVKRYLGTNERLIVDHEIITGAKNAYGRPETKNSLELEAGDIVMLCSDGLSDLVTGQDLLDVLKKHSNAPQAAVDELIKQANANGGTDNITAVAIALRNNQSSNPATVLPAATQRKKAIGRVIPVLLLLICILLAGGAFFLLRPSEAAESEVAVITETASVLAPSDNTATAQAPVPAVEETAAASSEPNPATSTPIATTANGAAQESTSTPILTFTPAPTSTPLPSATLVPSTQSGVVSLLEPPSGAAVKAIPVRFRVQVRGKQESDILQLRMWETRVDHQRTVTTQWRSVGGDIYEAEVERLHKDLPVGRNYSWSVVLIGADGTVRDALATPRQIQWNQPTGYLRQMNMALLEPAVNSEIKNSELEFKVRVNGLQESDTLQLWMGSNASHLLPVQADWFPMADATEMVATLTQAPQGYSKQYYWTVTLVDPRPLPVPDAIPFWWDE